MNKEFFVQNVKELCLKKGIKPTNACKESSVGGSFLSDISRGQTPSVAKVQLLAEYLGVTTSELLGEVPISSDPEQVARDTLTEQLAQSVRVQLSEEKKPIPAAGDGPRAEAHRLVDQIPPDRLAEAVRYIKFITETSDME